jgi:hypothetical protein
MSCTEERYLEYCKKNNVNPSRHVHYLSGHTVYGNEFEYGFDQRFRVRDYKTQTLDLSDPYAHWIP